MSQIFSCVLLLAAAMTMEAADMPAWKLARTVPLPHVKGGFDLMATDTKGQRLFLCAEDNDTLEVIDLKVGKHLRSVTGLQGPKWVVYRPEANRLYISNGDGPVRVLDAQTFAPVKSFPFKEKSNNLRYDPATGELFVGVGKTFGNLSIINTRSDTITGEIPLANFPKQFEVEADRIFVNVPAANHVAVIDRRQGKVVAIWPVTEAKENVPMALDRKQHRLFVGCEPGKLVVFDTATGKSVAALDIAAEPDGIYYDAKRRQLYVSCGAGSVDVIRQRDADHYEFVGRVPTAPGAATSLFEPTRSELYVAVPQKDNQKAELRIYRIP